MTLLYPKTANLIRFALLPLLIVLATNVFGQPIINSFSPASGPMGSTVTITGSNFSATQSSNIVYFGTSRAQVVGATASSLSVTVPTGASYQPITVTTGGLTAYSRLAFDITFTGGAGSLALDSFSLPKKQGVAGTPLTAILADCNGDGLPDAAGIVPSGTNGSSIYQNGGGSGVSMFSGGLNIGQGIGAGAFGDLDGDGLQEFVAGDGVGNGIDVYHNTSIVGQGLTFAAFQYTGTNTGSAPTGVAIADVDGDGRPDVISANNNATISILRNTTASPGAAITFAYPPVNITAPNGYKLVTVGDLDGDGKTDIIITLPNGSLMSVFRNTSNPGSISFAAEQDITTGSGPRQPVVGDIDGDGKPDIAIVNFYDKNLVLFRNTSTAGSIQVQGDSVYSTGNLYPKEVAIGDLDGDGKPDVAVATTGGGLNFDSLFPITLYKNVGGPGATHLLPGVGIPGDYSNYSISMADMNGDGRLDLVTMDAAGRSLNVRLNGIGAVAPPPMDTPHITSFTPVSGTTGTVVNIYGRHLTNTVNVLFGLYPSVDFTVVSDTLITAKVGGGDAGTRPIYLTYAGGGRDSLAGFTFVPPVGPIHITSFSPRSGTRGTNVQIHGVAFTGAQRVSFGAVNAQSYSVVSDTVITAVVGSGASGQVLVVGMLGIDSVVGFTYVDTAAVPDTTIPVVHTVLHSFAPSSGGRGTVVQIRGAGLHDVNTVTFGKVHAAGFTVINDSTINAVVGNGASGLVFVSGPHGLDSLPGFRYIDSSATDTMPPPPPGDTTKPTPPTDTTKPVLPPSFKLVSFSVSASGASVVAQWQTANDQKIVAYEVQHAFDSTHFSGVGVVASYRMATGMYILMDSTVRTGTNYYRLKMLDTAGTASYSYLVGIGMPGAPATLTGYPNPAVGSLYVPVPTSTVTAVITVSDMSGHVVKTIVVPAGAGYIQVDLHGLNKGVYKVVWTNGVTSAYQTVLVWN